MVILLSPVLILYGMMMPHDPHFSYKFLDGHKPIRVGFVQDMGGGHDGSEFAVYHWRGPVSEVVLQAKGELTGATMKDHGNNYVEFLFKDGSGLGFMATRLTTGKFTFQDKYDVPDPNFVTVIAQRRLPEGLFSELRVIFFQTRFFD